MMATAPASHSSPISRSTPPIGARAPPPVSSAGVLLDGPGEFLQVSWLGEHLPRRCGDQVGWQRGIHRRDRGGQDGQRVPVITVGALRAAGLSFPVAAGDDAGLPAGRAASRPADAHAAEPVLAASLERAQRLAARHAHRRGDHAGAGVAQRDQQVPGHARCGRPAVGEDRRPPGEGLGELALLGPAAGDAPDGRLGRLPVQARLDAGDQADRDADRVGQHVRDAAGHRSVRRPG